MPQRSTGQPAGTVSEITGGISATSIETDYRAYEELMNLGQNDQPISIGQSSKEAPKVPRQASFAQAGTATQSQYGGEPSSTNRGPPSGSAQAGRSAASYMSEFQAVGPPPPQASSSAGLGQASNAPAQGNAPSASVTLSRKAWTIEEQHALLDIVELNPKWTFKQVEVEFKQRCPFSNRTPATLNSQWIALGKKGITAASLKTQMDAGATGVSGNPSVAWSDEEKLLLLQIWPNNRQLTNAQKTAMFNTDKSEEARKDVTQMVYQYNRLMRHGVTIATLEASIAATKAARSYTLPPTQRPSGGSGSQRPPSGAGSGTQGAGRGSGRS